MKLRRKRTIQVLAVFATLGLIYFLISAAMSPPDPIYQGKPLSQHLLATPKGRGFFAPFIFNYRLGFLLLPEAEEPLKALGSEAIPLLDAWLDLPNSTLRDRLGKFAMSRGLDWHRFYVDRQKLAFCALYMTPSNAAPVTPKLIKFMQHGNDEQRKSATELLKRILTTTSAANRNLIAQQCRGMFEEALTNRERYLSDTFWLLARLSENYGEKDRERLLRRIIELRNVSPQHSAERYLDPGGTLRNLLHLESTNDALKVGAAILFRDSPIKPERVVPLLMQTLTSPNRPLLERSSQALAAYGTHAKPALPLLSNLLSHPRPAVTRAAQDAIAAITSP